MSKTEPFADIAKRLMDQFPGVMPGIIQENLKDLKNIQVKRS